MRPCAIRVSLVFIIALCATFSLLAESRVALVIGNGKYQYNNVLMNPANDAKDMAAALSQAGFDVVLRTDASLDDMNKALREFGNKLKAQKGVGLFYYSGHGTQVGGKSYLLAVDQDIEDADEVAYKALDAEAVLAKMQSAGNILNLVFLDACRNNPFPGSGRSGDRGLAVVKVDLPESVIVYAAEPGKIAADGEGRNSPFTQAFLKNMTAPGADILAVMKKVKAAVATATNGQQSPRVDQNLSRDFSFYPASGQVPAAPSQAVAAPQPAQASSASLPANFVLVPGGTFTMGSPVSEAGRNDSEVQHQVRLSSFAISKYDVTFDEYDAYCQATGQKKPDDQGWGRGSRPVINVSWYDAVAFCNWLSKQEGLRPAYTINGTNVSCDWSVNGYRLPTEAEWEFAAKGGAQASILAVNAVYEGSINLDQVAWYGGNSGKQTHPVGQKAANSLGLYDMAGNVWQWCWDLYGNYPTANQSDPRGPTSGEGLLVLRGGSWNDDAQFLRSTRRIADGIGVGIYYYGFRLALSQPGT
jgi:formylglycine-generating enzyme required for sulfatase activity